MCVCVCVAGGGGTIRKQINEWSIARFALRTPKKGQLYNLAYNNDKESLLAYNVTKT